MAFNNFSTTVATVTNEDKALPIKTAVYSLLFIASVVGNTLLIITLVRFKRLQSHSRVLIMHLAICDMTRAVFGILIGSIITAYTPTYPLGPVGCKSMFQLATHSTNTVVFTFICITIERYYSISRFSSPLSKTKWIMIIMSMHLLSLIIIVPLFIYVDYNPFTGYCHMNFPKKLWGKIYTLALFCFQYGFPLPLMIVLYSMLWLKIREQNKKMIDMTEEFESKLGHELNGYSDTHSDINIRLREEHRGSLLVYQVKKVKKKVMNNKAVRVIRKRLNSLNPRQYMSHISRMRHKQTVKTFKTFVTIVSLFAMFSLPSQIYWILFHFYDNNIYSPILNDILIGLAITNPALNCWIYGGFNKNFRLAYKDIIFSIFGCSRKKINNFNYSTTAPQESHISHVNTPVLTRDSQKCEYRFSEMFDDQIEHFEKYQHLYFTEDNENVDKDKKEMANTIEKNSERKRSVFSNLNGIVSYQSSRKKSMKSMHLLTANDNNNELINSILPKSVFDTITETDV